MEQNIHFERCVDFLARMIEKYGDELLMEERVEENQSEPKRKTDHANDVA